MGFGQMGAMRDTWGMDGSIDCTIFPESKGFPRMWDV